MTDDEERDEWFALRDAAIAQNPGMEHADVFKGLSLTLWRIVKQQQAAIEQYLRETG